LYKVRTGEHFGVPVTGRRKERERHRRERWSKSDPRRAISALFEQSGGIAPIDFSRFGKRAGEIIADAVRLPRRQPH
jgi:hypothetical protein